MVTEELEKEMISSKKWQMVGESKATERPTNSLLEKTPQFEIASKMASQLQPLQWKRPYQRLLAMLELSLRRKYMVKRREESLSFVESQKWTRYVFYEQKRIFLLFVFGFLILHF